MTSEIRDRRPTIAVALAMLAVVLAAGGADALAAKAKALFTGRDIKNGTIRPVDLHPQVAKTLTGAAGGQLEGPFSDLQLRESAVGARQIVTGGVGTSELADGAVTSAKVPDDALTGNDVDEASLAFPSASSQRTALANENAISADLGALGTVTLSCLGNGDRARATVSPPPADTTPTNVAIELNSESGTPTVLGERLAGGGAAAFLETDADPAASAGFSGKVTVARVGEVSRHAVVEIAGATRLGGAGTCWLDLEVTR
jgi:hypothetical protein